MSPLRSTTQKIEHKYDHQHTVEVHEHRDLLATILRAVAVLLLLLLFLRSHGWAQGVKPTGQGQQHVVCDSGCGSPPATADGSAFAAGSTDVTPIAGVFNDSVANLTTGTYGAPRLTNNRLLMVDCASGCSASAGFADNSSFTVGTTPITNLGAYFTSGADPALTTGNAARLRMDLHSYLLTTLGSPIPAGTNVIGHVIADSGSTTAVTSLPALPAGTNVIGHVIADSGSTTAVTGNVASTVADGANVTLGAKADAKSTATDTTAVTFMQVLKEISFMEQTPASRAVTNAGTFAVQAAQSGTWNFGISAGANLIGSVNLGTTPDPCGPGQAKSYAFYDASTNGATQIVALSSGKIVYVCSYSITSSSTTANTIKLVYGTGSNCATGQTAITPGYVLQAATSTGPIGKVNPNSAGLATAASNELCVLTNAAQAAQVEVSYVQQ